MIFIILAIITAILLFTSMLIDDNKLVTLFKTTNILLGISSLSLILVGIIGTAQTNHTTTTQKIYLQTVDNETLNGRQYYLIKNTENTYTYSIKNKDGSTTPKNTYNKQPIKIFENEEEKPYLERTITQQKDNTFWVPWAIQQNHVEKQKTYNFHIPTKSVRYYIPAQ
jgi:hypothetical protein